MIRVNLARSGETSLLEINVEIDGANVKAPNDAAGPARFKPPVQLGSASPGPPRRGGAAAVRDTDSEAPWVKPG
jgi:hypothetical protein